MPVQESKKKEPKEETVEMSNMELSTLPILSNSETIRKLNMSKNNLNQTSISSLNCNLITLLNLSNNVFTRISGLEHLKELLVLNLSHNQITSMINELDGQVLKALILNNNRILKINGLSNLKELNSLVLSHNQISSLDGLNLPNPISLLKLSVAHNNISSIPDLKRFVNLKEIRLNNNTISNIENVFPESLEILDIGSNSIKTIDDISCFSTLPRLVNLNLKGNEITNIPDFKNLIISLIPNLRVLNGERFDERFLIRKRKRESDLEKSANRTFKEIRLAKKVAKVQNDQQAAVEKPEKEEKLAVVDQEVQVKDVEEKQKVKDLIKDIPQLQALKENPVPVPNRLLGKNSNSGLLKVIEKTKKKSNFDVSSLEEPEFEIGLGGKSSWE